MTVQHTAAAGDHLRSARVFVAGHAGLVGSAIVEALAAANVAELLLRTHAELDLGDRAAVAEFFAATKPDVVILAAARVGGIEVHRASPAEFLTENLRIQDAVLEAARRARVQRLLFLASAAMYPAFAAQPMREDALWTGAPDAMLRPYALAKLAGVELCGALNRQYGMQFLSVVPPNIYGPGGRWDAQTSGVVAGLLRRMHAAVVERKEIVDVWGTGAARRELLFASDLAAACVHLLQLEEAAFAELTAPHTAPLINVGAGTDVSIRELAETIASVTGFAGELRFDASRPEGSGRRLLDSSRMRALGWQPTIALEQGLGLTYHAVRDRL